VPYIKGPGPLNGNFRFVILHYNQSLKSLISKYYIDES